MVHSQIPDNAWLMLGTVISSMIGFLASFLIQLISKYKSKKTKDDEHAVEITKAATATVQSAQTANDMLKEIMEQRIALFQDQLNEIKEDSTKKLAEAKEDCTKQILILNTKYETDMRNMENRIEKLILRLSKYEVYVETGKHKAIKNK